MVQTWSYPLRDGPESDLASAEQSEAGGGLGARRGPRAREKTEFRTLRIPAGGAHPGAELRDSAEKKFRFGPQRRRGSLLG